MRKEISSSSNSSLTKKLSLTPSRWSIIIIFYASNAARRKEGRERGEKLWADGKLS